MSNVFFTSDTHFGHKNIIKHCNRPFKSTEDMDEAMIANWNAKVSKGDRVYHVGDMFVYCDAAYAERVLGRLNGQVFLIRGNHDDVADDVVGIYQSYNGPGKSPFGFMRDYYRLKLPDPEPLSPDSRFGAKQHIVLFHYAMRTWHHKHRGVWHLYGHSHGTLPDLPGELCCDIGVDSWEYAPVSYDELKAHFAWKLKRVAQATRGNP